jgi:hypothetical protein
MKAFLLAIGLICFSTFTFSTEAIDEGESESLEEQKEYITIMFEGAWLATTNMWLGSQDPSWTELSVLDPLASQGLAGFWFTKCHIAQAQYWSAAIAELRLEIKTGSKLAALQKRKTKIEFEMLQCYFYDHSAEIQSMINMRLGLAKNGRSTTLTRLRGLADF